MSESKDREAGTALAEAPSSAPNVYDALRILMKIAGQYEQFCDVMRSMPERRNELRAGSKFLDSLDNLRDELLKRKPEPPNADLSDHRRQKP